MSEGYLKQLLELMDAEKIIRFRSRAKKKGMVDLANFLTEELEKKEKEEKEEHKKHK
jgi:hypothetical protein